MISFKLNSLRFFAFVSLLHNSAIPTRPGLLPAGGWRWREEDGGGWRWRGWDRPPPPPARYLFVI